MKLHSKVMFLIDKPIDVILVNCYHELISTQYMLLSFDFLSSYSVSKTLICHKAFKDNIVTVILRLRLQTSIFPNVSR